MRTRQGFVSNSSSSSFIVAWEKKPKTAKELIEMLFGDQTMYFGYDDSYPVTDVGQWLFDHLEWNKKKIQAKFLDNLESRISALLDELTERYTNTFTLDKNDQIVSCLALAKQEVQQIVATLKKHFPRINWQKRIDAIIAYRRKWHLISEELLNKLHGLTKQLCEKHNCVCCGWRDTSKMTKKEKEDYEKNRRDFENMVLKNPAYIALDKKHKKALNREYGGGSKKLQESLKLIASCLAEIFYKENEGAIFSIVEIHDDTPMGSAMEHGELFNCLPHQKFSHH